MECVQFSSAAHVLFDRTNKVFVTRFRRRVFDGEALQILRAVFSGVCHDFGATLIAMNGKHDHAHLVVEYPPKVPVSSLVNSLKGVSSRLLHRRRPAIRQRYWNGVLWSPSYLAASCDGATPAIVREYIAREQAPLLPAARADPEKKSGQR